MTRYAVSDLHGQLDLYNQIKEYINDTDYLYVLGDCSDRGPEPWRTLQTIIDDPQCILLMGNHEHMFWRAAEKVLEMTEGKIEDFVEDPTYYRYNPSGQRSPLELLDINGGWQTLIQWAQEPNYMYYYDVIRGLPLDLRLPTADGEHYIYLSHAGYNPGEYRLPIRDFVWDRYHYCNQWNDAYSGDIIVHGHTPLPHMKWEFDWRETPYDTGKDEDYFVYDRNFKYDIDLGAHYTGRTCLLNLDTLEPKVFETEIKSDDLHS